MLSQNDGMAWGAAAALGAGRRSGGHQLRGAQTVSVWKDSRQLGKVAGEIASALAEGAAFDSIEGAPTFSGGEKGVEMNAILLARTPLTRGNLGDAIEAGHISKEQACEGAAAGVAAATPDTSGIIRRGLNVPRRIRSSFSNRVKPGVASCRPCHRLRPIRLAVERAA